MNELEFAAKLAKWLEKQQLGRNVIVENRKRLPYALEVNEYCDEGEDDVRPTLFETDILISMKTKSGHYPVVVIETKLSKITTHAAMVYGLKADHHRAVHPYLRYGILIGDRRNQIPGRLIRHGTKFNFLVALGKTSPSKSEGPQLVRMLRSEIKTASELRTALTTNRSQNRQRFWCIHSGTTFK